MPTGTPGRDQRTGDASRLHHGELKSCLTSVEGMG